MSDNKWDRIKRAFHIETTDKLVNVRDGKITAALALVDAEINKLVAAGLDDTDLRGRRNAIDQRRNQANLLTRNDQKDPVLKQAKKDARDLAAAAPGEVAQQIGDLQTELSTVRRTIKTQVDVANGQKNPICKAVLDTPRQAVELAAQQAETQPNDHQKRLLLKAIDLQPLKDALAQTTPAQRAINQLNQQIIFIPDKLRIIPQDHPTRDGYDRELDALKQKQATLANLTTLPALLQKAGDARDEANDLYNRVEATANPIELTTLELGCVRSAIKTLVDQANAIGHAVGNAIVNAELAKVVNANRDGERLGTEAEKLDALQKIDLVPLSLALSDAHDLDAGAPRLLAGMQTMIGKITDGKTQKSLGDELAKLQDIETRLNLLTDLEKVRAGFQVLKKNGNDLMKRVLKASGKDGYEDALKAQFGITLEVTEGATFNLAKTYEMLNMIPGSHAGHDKLKLLRFNNNDRGGGDYVGGRITIGNIDDSNIGTYMVDGKPVKVNQFNHTMLHEIGHSIDDKYKIMAGLEGVPACGNWRAEKPDAVAQALADAAVAGMKNPPDPLKGRVLPIMQQAILGTAPTQPEHIDPEHWSVLQKYAAIGQNCRSGSSPWFNANPNDVVVGERVYVETKQSEWNSYKLNDRAASYVSNYQWRSPVEWFAEVYGTAWVAKKKPAGVATDLAHWLPP